MPSVYGCPLEDIMTTKNVAIVRFEKEGRTFWKVLPHSMPIGQTFSTTLTDKRFVFQFRVDHVHVAGDQDVRVMCLVGNDSVTNKSLLLEVFADIGKAPEWGDLAAPNGANEIIENAVHHAIIGWHNSRTEMLVA